MDSELRHDELIEQRLRERAYEIWQSRQREDEVNDWLKAEAEVSLSFHDVILVSVCQPGDFGEAEDFDGSVRRLCAKYYSNPVDAVTSERQPVSVYVPSHRLPPIYGPTVLDHTTLATMISALCTAGGAKIFVDFLKVWIEERKGRLIRIKKGDVEVELQGAVNVTQIQRAIELLESGLTSPRPSPSTESVNGPA